MMNVSRYVTTHRKWNGNLCFSYKVMFCTEKRICFSFSNFLSEVTIHTIMRLGLNGLETGDAGIRTRARFQPVYALVQARTR